MFAQVRGISSMSVVPQRSDQTKSKSVEPQRPSLKERVANAKAGTKDATRSAGGSGVGAWWKSILGGKTKPAAQAAHPAKPAAQAAAKPAAPSPSAAKPATQVTGATKPAPQLTGAAKSAAQAAAAAKPAADQASVAKTRAAERLA